MNVYLTISYTVQIFSWNTNRNTILCKCGHLFKMLKKGLTYIYDCVIEKGERKPCRHI